MEYQWLSGTPPTATTCPRTPPPKAERRAGGPVVPELGKQLDDPTFSAATPQNQPLLRPYQVDFITRLKAEIAAGRRRSLGQAPTGGGKTVIAAAFAKEAVDSGK